MIIQHSTPLSGTGSVVLTLNSVPEGAMLFTQIGQYTSAVRTYTVQADNGVGEFDDAITSSFGANIFAAIRYKHSVAAGNYQITVQANTGTTLVHGLAGYITGLDPAASPIVSSFDDGLATDTHYCGAVGEIDTTTPAAIICGAIFASAPGGSAASGDYTEIVAASSEVRIFYQYKLATAAVTDDRGLYTTTGTQRQGRGLMAAFPELAAPASNVPEFYPRITQRRLSGGLF